MNDEDPYGSLISKWLRDIGVAHAVQFGDRLVGATTATLVTASVADDRALVIKIYDHEIEGVGRSDVERDAAAMVAAAEVGLTAPVLVDSDPGGERLGWPALIMTRLLGRPHAYGGERADHWVDGLADTLISISRAPHPTLALPSYRSWLPPIIARPAWSTNDALWSQIASVLAEDLPSSPPRLIHRDFHQLNVVWHDGRPTGTVDWVNGCMGPIESDLASGRVNIALADRRYDGVGLADRFLDRCLDAGLPWHPAWDLDFIAGVTDRPEVFLAGAEFGADMTVESIELALETMAETALQRL